VPKRDAQKRATIDDVASIAGVSTASVSRALSGSRAVRAETLKRVTEAANRLDYRINPAASALRSKVTRTVGMVVPDIDNPFFPAVVKAVEGALHGSGMSLFLCDANDSPEVEAERLEALLSRGVDGVLISPVDGQRSRPALAAAAKRVPLVQLDRRVQVESDVVSVDHGRGIELVVEHLISEGRTSFAFVTTARRLSVAVERLEAYVQGVRVVDKASATRVLAGDLSIGWGREAGARLAASYCPEAVICANDLIALGLWRAFRQRGIRVPEDVALTGYDDSILADTVGPGLTSVRQPLETLGQEAVRLLMSSIESPTAPRRDLRLLPELVVRGSSLRAAPLEDLSSGLTALA
jgi:LacI family transcriptional regulator